MGALQETTYKKLKKVIQGNIKMKIGFDLQPDQDQMDIQAAIDDHFQPCSEVNDTIKGE